MVSFLVNILVRGNDTVFHQGKGVSSVKAADVDTMVVEEDTNQRLVYFFSAEKSLFFQKNGYLFCTSLNL